jgi:hypothetical protein
MAKQTINLGNTVNDGTGDALRVGAQKINANFTELYNLLGGDNIQIVSSVVAGLGLIASSASGEVTISAQQASANTAGVVKIGAGITVSEDGTVSYTLPRAATNILGGIKVGNNLSINNEGVLSADAQNYVLPTASPTTKGGIQIGSGLEVVDGLLNVTVSEVASALQDGPATLTYSAITGQTQSILQSNFGVSLFSSENNFTSVGWSDISDSVNQVITASTGTTIIHQNITEGTSTQWRFRPDGVLVGPEIALGSAPNSTSDQLLSLLPQNNLSVGNSTLSSYIRFWGNSAEGRSGLSTVNGVEISSTLAQGVSAIRLGGINFSSQNFPPTGTPTNTLAVNSEVSGGMIFYGDVVITAGSKLGIRNSIVFQDGTEQTTAYQGQSPAEITIDRLTNGDNEVLLDSTGALNIVNKIYSASSMELESITETSITAGTNLRLFSDGIFTLRNYSTVDGVSISTNFSTPDQKSWLFNNNGSTTLPTATVPTTAKGAIGDQKGMFIIDDDYIYYCKETYTDGVADIWNRTAQTSWSN